MFRSSPALRFIYRARGFAHSSVSRGAPSTPSAPQLPYFISRNSRGSIPVYTDVRNAGTRYLVLIRNIEGNVNVRLVFLSSFPSHRPRAFLYLEKTLRDPPSIRVFFLHMNTPSCFFFFRCLAS